MNLRTLAFTALLLATAMAFGGVAETDHVGFDLVEPAAASCTDIGFGCTESQVCGALERATGKPWHCIE